MTSNSIKCQSALVDGKRQQPTPKARGVRVVCWVANTRTIWAHLFIKHGGNIATADEALRLYRDGDTSSEMAYKIWAAIHRELDTATTRLTEMGANLTCAADVKPGLMKYLWADAIADNLYVLHH